MTQIKELSERLEKGRREAEERDAQRRAEKLGAKYLNLISVRVPTEIKAMTLVPEEKAREALVVPLQIVRKKLVLAVFDPTLSKTKTLIEELKKSYELEILVVSKTGLAHAWEHYQYVAKETEEISGRVEIDDKRLRELEEKFRSLEELGETVKNFKSPYTSELLEIFLAGGMALHASDIHLEPTEEASVLRLRIDGLLHNVSTEIEGKRHLSIITRIKLLSNLKLNIHDRPQDGRFTIDLSDRDIEIRTSLIPSEYGETAVLRLLDPKSLKVNLEDLGWRKDDLEIVRGELEKPNGLILNTGPTGSGKTTTLYAFLRKITTPEVKIITIEDPIEYHLPGISQTQVDSAVGYTFASGLRSILRQDPDVILVGEIRDKETSEIALNASLTGHLVFSTLHTNDAVGAIPRFMDLGAKPQILGPALTLVIAQRLVRVLCPKCKVQKQASDALKTKIEKFLEGLPNRVNKKDYQNFKIYSPTGCSACGNLGFRGRTSIFELFVINEKMEGAIYKNPTEIELKNLAKEQEMVTMQEDGMLKVLKGTTSIEEVERTTGKIEWLNGLN